MLEFSYCLHNNLLKRAELMLYKFSCGIFLITVSLIIRSLTVYCITGFVVDIFPNMTQPVRVGLVVLILGILALIPSPGNRTYKITSDKFIEDVYEGFGEVIGSCGAAILLSYLVKIFLLHIVL